MTHSEFKSKVEARIEGTCACCAVTLVYNDGNGIVCGACYETQVRPMSIAEHEARIAAIKAERSKSAKAAAETRKLNDGSISRNGTRYTPTFASQAEGQRKYQAIRAKYSRSRGWM